MDSTMSDNNIIVGDHRDLLDIIDSLRSQGASRYIDLPEIIVCGDQSAGKSSVLEAISGFPFPTRDGLCTRFATELILRRGPEVNTKVSITPGESRFGDDRERLETWQPKSSVNKGNLGELTDEAKHAMADPGGTREFYDDTLRIELTGPKQPHLTMVDLPGLFKSSDKEQSHTDAQIVHDMVERYMAQPRSIILTVISAKYDYVLQEVSLMAKRADPDGRRTMGLITKPDTLDVGSDSESYFVRLVRNLEAELHLGWHVLKNRNFEERDVTLAVRDEIESEFFKNGLWNSVDPSDCGVVALRARLSALLKSQIIAQLPSLIQDVEDGIADCDGRLSRLGPVRDTAQDQLRYLVEVGGRYTSLMTQAVQGPYTDRFFGCRTGTTLTNRFSARLRAVIESRREAFAEDMRLNGQSQYIHDAENGDDHEAGLRDVPRVSRSEYLEEVTKHIKLTRGRELPGLFNPLIVSDLFVKQSAPWGTLARTFAEEVLEEVHLATQLIVEHITASDVTEGILRLLRQAIDELKLDMDAKIDSLISSTEEHHITSDPQLIRNVQQTQLARYQRAMKDLIFKTFGSYRFDSPEKNISINPIELMKLVERSMEPNTERFGSASALDYMEAYYKVAMTRFIDDVSVLAIEGCLLSKLSTLFLSSSILEMSPETIEELAGETAESSLERKRLTDKRQIFETGLKGLRSLHKRKRNATVRAVPQDPALSGDSEDMSVATPNHSVDLPTREKTPRSVNGDGQVRIMEHVPVPVGPWLLEHNHEYTSDSM